MNPGPGGRFVVLEGAEGTGKSTQARRLAADLRSLGAEVVETREPGGTPAGERIRELLLHQVDLDLPAMSELFLVLAARAAFVADVVRPALAGGAWVVSDRFDLSTFAYQGHGRGIDIGTIDHLNSLATNGLTPHLYLVLDLDPAMARARQVRQGKGADRIEAAGDAFLGRVRTGYVELARSRSDTVLVPADGTEGAVEERIRAVMRTRFPELYGSGAG